MADNVIRFPGFLLLEDGKRFAAGCEIHRDFAALVRTMTRQEMDRAYRWHLKRKGGHRTSYKGALLRFSEIAK